MVIPKLGGSRTARCRGDRTRSPAPCGDCPPGPESRRRPLRRPSAALRPRRGAPCVGSCSRRIRRLHSATTTARPERHQQEGFRSKAGLPLGDPAAHGALGLPAGSAQDTEWPRAPAPRRRSASAPARSPPPHRCRLAQHGLGTASQTNACLTVPAESIHIS